MDHSTTIDIKCFHCATVCSSKAFTKGDKHFCCFGCQTVYEILQDNDMEGYYDLEDSPGQRMNKESGSSFEFLDNEVISEKLLSFNSEKLQKLSFSIPSIHCSSCIWLLENLSSLDKGIITSNINFSEKKLSINLDPSVTSIRDTAELLSQLGYPPVVNLESIQPSEESSNRRFFTQVGVAGFCFGNIMLLSFPEYIGVVMDETLKVYFSYLSLLLALPVVFFGARDYFTAAFKGLKEKIVNIDTPIALGVSALFLESCYQVISHTGQGYFDSLAALVFFLLIGKWFQNRTYQGLSFERDYKSYFPLAVQQIKNGSIESVPVYELDTGDIIQVRNQEIIPADSILLQSGGQIDYSFVTGEARPVLVAQGEKVYAGGRLIGRAQRFEILKPASQSYLTQLWNDHNPGDQTEPATRPLIDRISRSFTIAIMAIALISAIVWLFIDPVKTPIIFTSVLIVACPCALALATPFTLGTAMNVLGKNDFYVKNSMVLEKLWNVDHIVFDKTGTLTSIGAKRIVYSGPDLTEIEKYSIKQVVKNSIHPYSQMIDNYLQMHTEGTASVMGYQEILGQGITGSVNGLQIKLGSEAFILGMQKNGGNTAKAPEGRIYVSINDECRGHFSIVNQWRQGIDVLLNRLKNHFKLSLLSGDNSAEANALQKIFPSNSIFLFNQKPEQKASFIKEHQAEGQKIIMLGDGLNDAIALKESYLGVAITDNMSAFTPASDVIAKGDSLTLLNRIMCFAQRSKWVIVASFVISFCYNLIGLSLAVSGNLQPVYAAILMPLSSISVVLFSTASIKLFARQFKLK